jgi:hypothetical protein
MKRYRQSSFEADASNTVKHVKAIVAREDASDLDKMRSITNAVAMFHDKNFAEALGLVVSALPPPPGPQTGHIEKDTPKPVQKSRPPTSSAAPAPVSSTSKSSSSSSSNPNSTVVPHPFPPPAPRTPDSDEGNID